ncbi:MAG TPA: DUF3105 domain-containing protein [Microlunatus sp.]|nr:DUF3105 domain-containing protein [Microlunatus sp.]
MAKKSERDTRRAVAEQMRQEQARKERRRSLLILGTCVLVVLGLLGTAVFVYVQDLREESRAAGTPLAELGATTSSAECSPVSKVKATGNNNHIDPATPIPYPEGPPASGPHWGNYLQGSEIRSFYTVDDRPEVERLVHSLEHGHTILWYDDTVKPGTDAYKDVQAISEKFDAEEKFIAAPWTEKDGKAFPEGKHVALTHWTGPENQQGITQYCTLPSGAVVEKFTTDYPASNAPEPNAP